MDENSIQLPSLKLKNTVEIIPKLLEGIGKNIEAYPGRGNAWELFDEGYFRKRIVDIEKQVGEISKDIIDSHPEFQKVFHLKDLANLFENFLEMFFTGRKPISTHGSLTEVSEDEAKECKDSLMNILSTSKLDQKNVLLFKKMLISLFQNTKDIVGIYIFPIFLFYSISQGSGLALGDVYFFQNTKEGRNQFKESFPEANTQLLKKIINSKNNKNNFCTKYFAVTKASGNKNIREAIKKIHIAFSLFKVILHKNRIERATGSHSLITQKRCSGISYHYYLQFNNAVNRIENYLNSTDQENYYYIDNFFDYTYGLPNNGFELSYINEKNLKNIESDLQKFNNFVDHYKNNPNSILTLIVNAATSFSEARNEINPIKQVILSFVSMENIVCSESRTDQGQSDKTKDLSLSKLFCQRLAHIIRSVYKDNWEIIRRSLNNTEILNHNTLLQFLENLYDYRSRFIHGNTRTINLKYNQTILFINAQIIIAAVDFITNNDISTLKRFQKDIEDMLNVYCKSCGLPLWRKFNKPCPKCNCSGKHINLVIENSISIKSLLETCTKSAVRVFGKVIERVKKVMESRNFSKK